MLYRLESMLTLGLRLMTGFILELPYIELNSISSKIEAQLKLIQNQLIVVIIICGKC